MEVALTKSKSNIIGKAVAVFERGAILKNPLFPKFCRALKWRQKGIKTGEVGKSQTFMLDKSGGAVQSMFSDIAGTYDLLNHLLSGNQDRRWRRRAASQLSPRRGELILDLCCGTGDSTRQMNVQQPHCRVVGADFAFPMLQVAQRKQLPALVAADALGLPFSSDQFDAVSVAFGARNFEDTRAGLSEIHRVLKPGGRLLILEFMRPTSPLLQSAFGAFNWLLAPLGRAVSHHGSAYNYLPQSIGGFYTRREFEVLLREVGFGTVRSFNFSGGVATSFLGRKAK